MVVIHIQLQTVVDPPEVDTCIELVRCFPFQVGVGRSSPINHRHTTGEHTRVGVISRIEQTECTVGTYTLITRLTIGETELEVGEYVPILDPLLIRGAPCECTRAEGRPLVVLRKTRTTIRAQTEGE